MDRKILYVYILLLAVVVINGKGSYIVVAPNSIQPNNDYTVAITLPENTEPSTVEIEIAGGTTFKEKKLIEIPQYNTAITTFQIPMLENTVYTLKVQSIKGLEFSNSTNLKYVKSRHLQNDDLKNIEELQIASIHNETAKRFGPLNLKFKKEKYRIFRDIIMKANSTNPIPFLIYNVVVKGNIVKHEYLEISGDKTMEYITLTPTSDMLPSSNIFVYYMENNVFHWEDLSLFFATKSKCLKNDTEYDHLILNEGDDMDEEAEVEIRKPPGEESGLVILTNTHYSLDSGIELKQKNAIFMAYIDQRIIIMRTLHELKQWKKWEL
ncbi:uncharacterized protein LOC142226578 [Haematobia irritans]|uniref:uncharacterized protein LOC142226578 n=1 Tax=Haematobia irritans TaxID=7368 RepID=UPI003F4FA571